MAKDSSRRDMRWIVLAIAALVIFLDRVTKLWIVAHIPSGHAIVVIPKVFRLTHVLNTGAAFSMFEGSGSPNLVRNLLIGFSVVAVIVVLFLIWKMGRGLSLTSVSHTLSIFSKCISCIITGQTSTWRIQQLWWEPACFCSRCCGHRGVSKLYGDR
jgi:lipoprotein signal peptidase